MAEPTQALRLLSNTGPSKVAPQRAYRDARTRTMCSEAPEHESGCKETHLAHSGGVQGLLLPVPRQPRLGAVPWLMMPPNPRPAARRPGTRRRRPAPL